MTTKIAFIGPGSTIFAKNLIGDILSFPDLEQIWNLVDDLSEAHGDSLPKYY